MKTKKSLSRRVKITSSGKVLHASNFKRHLRRNKSKSQLRRLKKNKSFVSSINRKVKNALGVV